MNELDGGFWTRNVAKDDKAIRNLTSFNGLGGTGIVKIFFQRGKGIYVSDDFKRLILKNVSNKVLVGRNEQAGTELPEGHVFESVDNLLEYLADCIHIQWEGKEGVLPNDGSVKRLYVKVYGTVFTAKVFWNQASPEWYCFAVPYKKVKRVTFVDRSSAQLSRSLFI